MPIPRAPPGAGSGSPAGDHRRLGGLAPASGRAAVRRLRSPGPTTSTGGPGLSGAWWGRGGPGRVGAQAARQTTCRSTEDWSPSLIERTEAGAFPNRNSGYPHWSLRDIVKVYLLLPPC